LLEVERVGNS